MVTNILTDITGFTILGTFFVFFMAIFFIFYIVAALALMKIAQKTKTENEWLAWIPVANIYLMTNIVKLHWGFAVGILLLPFIPFIGGLVSIGLIIYVWWLICEKLKKPGILSLLILIPFINLILMLYLAFSD